MDVSFLIRLVDQFTGPAQKIRNAAKGIGEIGKELKGGFSEAIKSGFSVENIEQATKNAEGAFSKARGRLLGAFAMAITLGGPVKLAADFETGMNRVRALTNATGEEFAMLRKQALDLGRTTQFTTKQAADAQGFLAMAGFRANAIFEAMPGTLQLASSAQIDLARAADIVTNIMTGYNKKGSELAHVNDVLVRAFTSANTDLVQLAEAMKYAGPVASAAGMKFEEASASLALMGNAGIQASMAGTGLRGAVTRMLSPTKGVQKAMKEAGLTFTDSKGRLLPLVDIIKQLEPHADDAGLMMRIFGQRAGPAMMALVNQGSAALEKLTKELEDSGGTAERVSKVQMEGFNGVLKELQSAAEGTAIALGTLLFPVLTVLGNKATELLNRLTDFTEAHPALTSGIVLAVAGFMGLSIAGRLLSFTLAGLRLGLLPLIGLFLKFNKEGRNIGLGWRLLSTIGRGLGASLRIAGAGLAGFAEGALTAVGAARSARGGMGLLRTSISRLVAATWIVNFGFQIFDDMGRTPEQRIEEIRKNHERYQAFEEKVDQSSFGQGWQAIKDKANEIMGLEKGVIPAEVLSAWAKAKAEQFRVAASSWIDAMLAGLQGAWGRLSAWLDQSIAALGNAMNFVVNITWPEPPAWVSWLINKGKSAATATANFATSLSAPEADGKPSAWITGGSEFIPEQKVNQTINAEVIDKRPPNMTVNAPITITGVLDPMAAANAAAAKIGAAIANAKAGAMHGGTEE